MSVWTSKESSETSHNPRDIWNRQTDGQTSRGKDAALRLTTDARRSLNGAGQPSTDHVHGPSCAHGVWVGTTRQAVGATSVVTHVH